MLSLEKQEPESSSSEEAQAVTPWVVSGNVDRRRRKIEEMEDGITEVEDENKSNEEGEDKDDECTGNSSALFLTAAAQNLLCLKLAEELGVVIANPWVSWLKASLPAIISLLLTEEDNVV
ncbi:hypothetical protein Bca52824_030801 [Brassica carinata]|uniref:Uncharacterized protein n=1 Tax=Brassica carinata TaxID=52824 RepID=A0A8X7S924_BRACI|nr:hypothetical protein Bca52824_030801 [Brassica carinata]